MYATAHMHALRLKPVRLEERSGCGIDVYSPPARDNRSLPSHRGHSVITSEARSMRLSSRRRTVCPKARARRQVKDWWKDWSFSLTDYREPSVTLQITLKHLSRPRITIPVNWAPLRNSPYWRSLYLDMIDHCTLSDLNLAFEVFSSLLPQVTRHLQGPLPLLAASQESYDGESIDESIRRY